MRIGLDYTAAIHQTAGIGRYTRELVNALTDLEPDLDYRLFVAAGLAAKPLAGTHWHPTRLSKRWLERLWYRLRLPLPIEFWTGPVAVFHQPDFVLPPLRPQTPGLVTVHDLSFVREPDSVMPGMTRHLTEWVPDSVRRAAHVIAVSEATKQDLIELYKTPPNKITVIYHGVRPMFKPTPAAADTIRHRYRLGPRPFILSVGTVQPRKNYTRLIEALAHLDPDVDLVIAGGKGWGHDDVKGRVQELGLTERVHFPGFVADEDLPALYSAAEIFAYPSLYEGFGLPLLEAMACGTPVAAANRSALPEIVTSAGLLFDPFDPEAIAASLRHLLHDSALRQHLKQAGQAQASRYTWKKAAEQVLDLYRRIS